MTNGYVLAAAADLAAAHEVGDAFGLDVIDAAAIGDAEAVASALTAAPNVGLIISHAATQDSAFMDLLRIVAGRLGRAQVIAVEPDARAAFSFLPEAWPFMTLADARARAAEIARRRQPTETPGSAPEPEAPPPPVEAHDEPAASEEIEEPATREEPELERPSEAPDAEGDDTLASEQAPAPADAEPPRGEGADAWSEDFEAPPPPLAQTAPEPGMPPAPSESSEAPPERFGAPSEEAPPPPEPRAAAPSMPPAVEPPTLAPPPQDDPPVAMGRPGGGNPPLSSVDPMLPDAPPQAPAPARKSADRPDDGIQTNASTGMGRQRLDAGASAPADATAFAPRKLRRGTPELVQVAIHQPRDLKEVIKAARKADPRTESAPQGMHIGDVPLGASIGVALEARGVSCDGTMQRRPWTGAPLNFAFSVEAEEGVKQAVFIARVFVDDAQIGVIGFTRNIIGPKKKALPAGDAARLKRHKRVFLSYSSKDREIVSAIATAYQSAGIPHFFDRTSLKSGEQWSPRLRKEIDKADLFHLCWSRSAATSEWVEKEAEHALERNKRSKGKNPAITVQMLDGPPWAPHPPELDSINFDDFVRAAIVGYARGDGES